MLNVIRFDDIVLDIDQPVHPSILHTCFWGGGGVFHEVGAHHGASFYILSINLCKNQAVRSDRFEKIFR